MSAEFEALLTKTKSILSGINIPAQLAIIKDLMEEQRKSDPDMRRIAEIIGGDVRISAATLKRANSPFFGARGQIGSISQAVMQLGYRNVFCVVMSLSLQAASSFIKGKFMNQFWKHSNDVAASCFYLARKIQSSVKPDEAYVAGLFLDCGVPLLFQRFSDYEETYLNAVNDTSRRITDVEREKYETNHGLVGYVLCSSWDLPEEDLHCVLHHHDVSAETFADADKDDKNVAMLAIVKLSEHINNSLRELPDVHEWPRIQGAVCAYLGIDERKIESLKIDIEDMLAGEKNEN